MGRRKLLMILDRDPIPPSDGETYAIATHLEALRADWEIDLLRIGGPIEDIGPPFRDVFKLAPARRRSFAARCLGEVVSGRPVFEVPVDRDGLQRSGLRGRHYDAIYASPARLASWATAAAEIVAGRPRLVLGHSDSLTEQYRRDHDLSGLRGLDIGARFRHGLKGFRSLTFARVERALLDPFDLILVQTPKDRAAIVADCGASFGRRVVAAPNAIKESLFDLPYDGSTARSILCVGPFRGERRALLFWFVREVFAGVRRGLPDARLLLVGRLAELDRRRLEGIDGVVVRGFLPRMDDAFAGASITAVPLFYRSGLVNKVIDSMAAGVPCSGSSVFNGIEGFEDRTHGFNPATAAEWTGLLIDALGDPARLTRISEEARALVRDGFRRELTIGKVAEAFSGLGAAGPSPERLQAPACPGCSRF